MIFDESHAPRHSNDGEYRQPQADLAQEITQLAGHINAINYRFIKLLGEFDDQDGWQVDGVKTFAHWLNWKCGIGDLSAREKVRVARSLPNLPQIDEAFRTGEISYTKVRAMTRVATPENESLLLMIARHGTAQHVEQTVRKYRRCRKLEEPAAEQTSGLHSDQGDDGMVSVTIRLPAEEAELLLNAVEKMRQSIRRDRSGKRSGEQSENVSAETLDDPEPSFAEDRAAAIVNIAEHYLATSHDGARTLTGAERYEVIMHINVDEPHGCLERSGFVAPQVARKLACDARVTLVTEDSQGNVLNIGRRSRNISRAMRTALQIRDDGCQFPNCYQQHWTDAHHIKHWADGGETSLDNLVTLCRHHHRLLHQGDFRIANKEGKLVFYNQQSIPIFRTLNPQFMTGNPERVIGEVILDHSNPNHTNLNHTKQGITIDADTAVTKWCGESIDYDDTIEALFKLDGG